MRYPLMPSLMCMLAAVMLTGCAGYSSLPRVRTEYAQSLHRSIPENAPAVYTWHGSRENLKTYWGDQDLVISVSAYIPADWKEPGDCYWRVTASNAEGKPLPFLGVVHRYVNELGTQLTSIVPEFDPLKLDDGLYVVIDPGIEVEDGRVVRIQPVAMIPEIRRRTIMPFRPHVQLFPAEETALTPAPEQVIRSRGTPMGID